jgi:hypothetical protein
MTIRLSQLLFLSAGFAVVVAMAVIGFAWLSPTDGQYWSIDPQLSPEAAAEAAFRAGDYRFLGSRVYFGEAEEAEVVYGISSCRNHPLGNGRSKAFANFAELRGEDAWAKFDSIRDYADAYNFRLWDLLEKNTDTTCYGFDVG